VSALSPSTAERTRPSPLRWWQEGLILLVADQLFEFVRSLINPSATTALRNARGLVRLERWTWTFHERRVQKWVLPHHRLVEAMDIWYGTIHFVVPPIVLILLWRRLPERYARWRNTLVVATLLGLVCFVLYPLAPPRLLPGFVDTMRTVGGLGPLDSSHFKDTNSYAAMPSLHMAWSTWCACALAALTSRRWLQAAAFAYPAVTLLVIMATANHFFLDAVGGWIVLGIGWLVAARSNTAKFVQADRRGGEAHE
jgi:hypothetical protein